MSEYEAFVRDFARTTSGAAVVLTLRDLTPGRKKYLARNVRAVVSRPPKAGEPTLWLRSVVGLKDHRPCSIHILEELPDTFAAQPYSDLFTAMERLEES